MNGLREIKQMNDLPQTKREADYRVQRDRLAQVLRKVLDEEIPQGRTPKAFGAVEAANLTLLQIYGE